MEEQVQGVRMRAYAYPNVIVLIVGSGLMKSCFRHDVCVMRLALMGLHARGFDVARAAAL